mmetsp:Transcript_17776/g.62696  ORF Transcript_17776/g.62696 Transcript_17776/m.62696 type:complete len:267 (-) Transcript_17776:344-1144(-)
MSMPQWSRCSFSLGSITMSSSSGAYEYTSAPSALIVPSFTTSGYLLPVASKCASAAPVPPLPSQLRRPLPMWPVLRLSHRFSVWPLSSHFHPDAGMRLPLSSCSSVSAYRLTRRSAAASHVLVALLAASCRSASSCAMTARAASSSGAGRSGSIDSATPSASSSPAVIHPSGSSMTVRSSASKGVPSAGAASPVTMTMAWRLTMSSVSISMPPSTPKASRVGFARFASGSSVSLASSAAFAFFTRRHSSRRYTPRIGGSGTGAPPA